ncbi:MAG: P27 family phage terminase small subunit [Tepidisphaerales bacterium]
MKTKLPKPPAALTADQAAEFSRVAAELAQVGILDMIGADAIAAYSVAYVRWRDAEKALATDGDVVKLPNGYAGQNPYLAVSLAAARQMRGFQDRVGDAKRRAAKKAKASTVRPRMRIVDDDLSEAASG